MINQTENDWLSLLEKSVCDNRPNYKQLNVKSVFEPCIPLQKLLFSATLSGNAENLSVFNLFHPRLYVVSNSKQAEVVLPPQPQPRTTSIETGSNKMECEITVENQTISMSSSNEPKKPSSISQIPNDVQANQNLALEKYATPALLEVRFKRTVRVCMIIQKTFCRSTW